MDCCNVSRFAFFSCLRGVRTYEINSRCMQAFEGGGVHMLFFFIYLFCHH